MPSLSVAHQKNFRELCGIAPLEAHRFRKIFEEGEQVDAVYLIESGLVKLSVSGPEKKEIVVRIAGPGNLIGVVDVLADVSRTYSASALTPARLLFVPNSTFRTYCEDHDDLCQDLLRELARQQVELYRKIQLLVLHDVRHRLVDSLIDLAMVCGADGEGMHSVPLSQEDLAVVIGATRETTSNKLNALAHQNLVVLARKRITIPSLEALRTSLDRAASTSEA
jgi:CRP/FNR family transcriptional regulator